MTAYRQKSDNHNPNNQNNKNHVASNDNNQQSFNHNNSNNDHKTDALNLQIQNEPRQKPESTAGATNKKMKTKKKHRDRSDHGDNFVAPDGGWGWLVAIASGVNVLVTFASAQNFGIMYRERMLNLGITSTELTTIINIEIAMSTFSGLLNGPLFRRFTFRQIALVGSFLIFLGLFLSIFADSFILYVCSFSIIYGFGRGIIVSASSLALNTYFKQSRRTATAYQWGVAGLGPICLPYLATFLMQFFGVHGTVLIFSGISLHTFACSLIFHPVKWHVKKLKDEHTQKTQQQARTQPKDQKSETTVEPVTIENPQHCDDRDRDQQSADLPHKIGKEQELPNIENKPPEEEIQKRSFYQKIVTFFDLDLLLDITYINLAIGLTLVAFVETNFGILTPFILADFGFENNQIATAMSILGFSDLAIRFLIPVITSKMSFSNKTYFLCGVIGMSLGRVVLSITRNFYIMLGVFLWMGLNKAFRIVFWSLILPGYVPLKRLPAASGLQLMISSIFTMAVGPLIGLIRDKTNYALTVNFLNALCFLAVFTWILEALWRKRNQRKTKTASAKN